MSVLTPAQRQDYEVNNLLRLLQSGKAVECGLPTSIACPCAQRVGHGWLLCRASSAHCVHQKRRAQP